MRKVSSALLILFAACISLMAQGAAELKKMPVLYRIEGQEEKARVQKDIIYKTVGGKDLQMDLYSPAGKRAKDEPLPAVIFVSGASEMKNWKFFEGYGQLTAAAGMIAVQFNKRQGPGEEGVITAREDIADLIEFLRKNAARYGIDKNRLAVWSFSGGGFVIKPLLLPEQNFIRALVIYYGVGGAEREQLKATGEKMPPVLLVRAGRDRASVNENIDSFATAALTQNVRIELINYANGRHAFDLYDDREETRRIIRRSFEFIKEHLE